MVTHNRVTTLQKHCMSTLISDQLYQLFSQKMGLNQLLKGLRGLSEKAMVLTHLQCKSLFSFFLVFLTSYSYPSYILPATENAIQANNFSMSS